MKALDKVFDATSTIMLILKINSIYIEAKEIYMKKERKQQTRKILSKLQSLQKKNQIPVNLSKSK